MVREVRGVEVADFEDVVAQVYRSRDRANMAAAVASLERLRAELPGFGPAAFELANALDAAGDERRAEGLYREALELGVTGERQRRCVVQLASTLTALCRASESLEVLAAARAEHPEWTEVAVFEALALHDAGLHDRAMSSLLRVVAEEAGDPSLVRYRSAWTETADALAAGSDADQR